MGFKSVFIQKEDPNWGKNWGKVVLFSLFPRHDHLFFGPKWLL